MLKHIYLILVATFFFGFIAGFVLWLFNQTTEDNFVFFDENKNQPLTIIVHSYGGCESAGCASYRLEVDGSYTYIVRPRSAPEIYLDGEISSEERKLLIKSVAGTDFEEISNTSFSGTCPVAYDGLGFSYRVTYGDHDYEIDSCRHDLSGEELFNMLNGYFRVFQNNDRET